MNKQTIGAAIFALTLGSSAAMAMHHEDGKDKAMDKGKEMSGHKMGSDHSMSDGMKKGMKPSVMAMDQNVSNGIVSAKMVHADSNGWLVVHRTDDGSKPGPVVGYAPIRKGMTRDVAVILQEDVDSGDMLMLMVHSDDSGNETGVFEYTLGAKEDGPIKMDGNLVMKVVEAK